MNTFKTTLLLTALTLILVLGGEYFGGSNGALVAFAIAAVMNFASYFFSDKIALSMYGAQPVSETENQRFTVALARLFKASRSAWDSPCPSST